MSRSIQPYNKKLASAASPESASLCLDAAQRSAGGTAHWRDLALILSPTNYSYKQLISSISYIFLINSSWWNWDWKCELWKLSPSSSKSSHDVGKYVLLWLRFHLWSIDQFQVVTVVLFYTPSTAKYLCAFYRLADASSQHFCLAQ